jgi:DNA replication protein DnaC
VLTLLDEIESRIRSRLQDESFVTHLRITAPDYRRPTETSNPGISMLSLPEVQAMTFKNFETRENEVGTDVTTTITVEKKDRYGHDVKVREVTHQKVTQEDVKSLRKAVTAAITFAEEPHGWLVMLGGSYSGKTHLGAAIGNYRIGLGGQADMINVAEGLDHLRHAVGKTEVPVDRRLYEIKTTSMLILDDLRESTSLTNWGDDKLYQILNYRFYAQLPTVITSTLNQEEFAVNYPNLWNKILDPAHSQIYLIDMPPFRRLGKGKAAHKKGK